MNRKASLKAFFEKNRFATKAEAREFLYELEPDISTGGLRGWLNRQYDPGKAPWDREHTCPHCGKKAHGNDEIIEKFGLRMGGRYSQSRCKGCR